MKTQWKRITAQLADFKPEDRVAVPVGPLLWANEEIERLRAQRDALLVAMKAIVTMTEELSIARYAQDAIRKVGGAA